MARHEELLAKLKTFEDQYAKVRKESLADDNVIDKEEQSQLDRIGKMIAAIRKGIER